MLKVGAVGCALAVTFGIDTFGLLEFGSRDGQFFGSSLGYAFYFALILLVLGASIACTQRYNEFWSLARTLLQCLIVFGGLALPIFVFHGVVIPTKDILVNFGVGNGVALLIPLGAFVLMLLFGFARLFRMYFR